MKQFSERTHKNRTAEVQSADHQTSLADILVVAEKLDAVIPAPTDTGRDLDMIRSEQQARIVARIDSGKPLNLTGLAEKIYPKPGEPKKNTQVDDLRVSQQERLKRKEREFTEKKKSNELLQKFVQETQKNIQQACIDFQIVSESLTGAKSRFSELTKQERSEFMALAKKAAHTLCEISVHKGELFACIQFAQDHDIAQVSFSANQLTQYYSDSLNHARACSEIRNDISFDPGREQEIMQLLEETENLEEEFRSMLDKNLHMLRPDEDEVTRTRTTQDIKKEFLATHKRLSIHRLHEENPSIISAVLEDNFNKLDFVLKNRARNEKK